MCELYDGEFFSTDDHYSTHTVHMNISGYTQLQDENTVARFLDHTIVVFSVENLQNRQNVLENFQNFKKIRQIICESEVSVKVAHIFIAETVKLIKKIRRDITTYIYIHN